MSNVTPSTQQRTTVWSVLDAPMVESPDGGMRDSVILTDTTCGAPDMAGGMVWVKGHSEIHEDTHPFSETYYVVSGQATLIAADVTSEMKAGDVVFIPRGIRHRIDNPHDETFQIFWLIATRWSDLHETVAELSTWREVDSASGWHVA